MRTRQAQTRSPPESCSQTGQVHGGLQAGVRGEGKPDLGLRWLSWKGHRAHVLSLQGHSAPSITCGLRHQLNGLRGSQGCSKELKPSSQSLGTHLPPHLSCPLTPDMHTVTCTEYSAKFPKCLLGLLVLSPRTKILSGPPLPLCPHSP